MERTPILYDADCGLCKALLAGVLLWDRSEKLRPVPIVGSEGSRLLAGMEEDRRLASCHLVPPGDAPLSAGAAVAPLLRDLPGGAPLAAAAARLPTATSRSYEWVAANRSRLSRLVPGAAKRRADELIARRR